MFSRILHLFLFLAVKAVIFFTHAGRQRGNIWPISLWQNSCNYTKEFPAEICESSITVLALEWYSWWLTPLPSLQASAHKPEGLLPSYSVQKSALKNCALCTTWKQHINTPTTVIRVCSVCLHLCKAQALRQGILLCSDYSSAANSAQSQNIIFPLKSLPGLVKPDETDTNVNSTHCLCLTGCHAH